MSLDAYANALAASGKLKVKARAKLAFGTSDETFEACVLLHEAARTELRAVRLINAPPPTRFGALVEACGCLVEGRDPPGAARVWMEILRAGVDPATAEAMLVKVKPAFERSQMAYAAALAKLTLRGQPMPMLTSKPLRARREAMSMTSAFPGVPGCWLTVHWLAEARRDRAEAWDALQRAHRLEPEDQDLVAKKLLTATWALDRSAADELLAQARAEVDHADPGVCMAHALAELKLADGTRGRDQRERWEAALEAARSGLSRAPDATTRSHLRAAELFAEAHLEGNKPAIDHLYRAGLSDLAVGARAEDDLTDLLARSVGAAA